MALARFEETETLAELAEHSEVISEQDFRTEAIMVVPAVLEGTPRVKTAVPNLKVLLAKFGQLMLEQL